MSFINTLLLRLYVKQDLEENFYKIFNLRKREFLLYNVKSSSSYFPKHVYNDYRRVEDRWFAIRVQLYYFLFYESCRE